MDHSHAGLHERTRDVTPEQRELVDKAVEALEQDGGVPDRASSPLVDGSWRLIFTTTPGTASPVQRSFVGVDGFAIYQDIDIFSEVKWLETYVRAISVPYVSCRVTMLLLWCPIVVLHAMYCCTVVDASLHRSERM